ncbi:hypothetical protein TraAM80_04389 [Trypanosoma rangeli]|uniref:Uncharacterized protein n=1 Tax=Trypanosoma rangeli TaxID=5698 RepID=A0A3R7MNL6_TRYRA|nr:uncharacterized protein TraAM80_04389 [Trypanosoma rangeli]RNF05763.1 hypothetical protein TraAM80_04389 [Trypanosoma rangeli]|eukprot:RNF05763.1 hypothetical protein TraAM80_04389 [Trypanosoma rangeli]
MGAMWAVQKYESRRADGGPPRRQSRQRAAGSHRFGPPSWRSWAAPPTKAAGFCSLRARTQNNLVGVCAVEARRRPGICAPRRPGGSPRTGAAPQSRRRGATMRSLTWGKRLPTQRFSSLSRRPAASVSWWNAFLPLAPAAPWCAPCGPLRRSGFRPEHPAGAYGVRCLGLRQSRQRSAPRQDRPAHAANVDCWPHRKLVGGILQVAGPPSVASAEPPPPPRRSREEFCLGTVLGPLPVHQRCGLTHSAHLAAALLSVMAPSPIAAPPPCATAIGVSSTGLRRKA